MLLLKQREMLVLDRFSRQRLTVIRASQKVRDMAIA
jgi:hypothetical protein